MERNASVYQVYTVSRITGEGRAEFLRAWGPGFEQEGALGRGGGGNGRGNSSVRGNYKSFMAISYTVGFVGRKRLFSTEAQIRLSYTVEKGFFDSLVFD